MKTTILTITEYDNETGPDQREIARVDIPPVAEPLKLLVKLLQTVDDAGKPKRKYAKKGDAAKSRSNGAGVPA